MRHVVHCGILFLLVALTTFQQAHASSSDVFEVMHISQGEGYVVISGGNKHGLAVGDEICIFKEDNDEEPIGCGPLIKVRKSVAVAMIGKEAAQKAEVGMLTQPSSVIASLREASNLNPNPNEAEEPSDEGDIGDFGSAKEERPEPKKKIQKKPKRIKTEAVAPTTRGFVELDYAYVPMLPVSVFVPTFDVDARYAQSGSIWKRDLHVTSTTAQLQLALGIPLGPDTLGRIRLGYALVPNDSLNADFDPAAGDVYFRGEFASRFYSLGLDAINPITRAGKMRFEWFAGVMINRTEISFTGASIDDRDGSKTDFLRYESAVVITEARGGVSWLYHAKKWHTGVTAELGLPVFSIKTQKYFKHDLPASISEAQRESSQKDLEKTIDLKQAPVSFYLGLQTRYVW